MNRMGVPQPDYTPDGVLAEIARVVQLFSTAAGATLRHRNLLAHRATLAGHRGWIPDDDGQPSFDLFDQRTECQKPVEIPLGDDRILVTDTD